MSENKKFRKEKYPDVKRGSIRLESRLSILVVALVLFMILVLTKPMITGNVHYNREVHTQSIHIVANENSEQNIALLYPGELAWLKISGSIIGSGDTKIYLNADGNRFLVLDSKMIEDLNRKKLASNMLTGYIVLDTDQKENETHERSSGVPKRSFVTTDTATNIITGLDANITVENAINTTADIMSNITAESVADVTANMTVNVTANTTMNQVKTTTNTTTSHTINATINVSINTTNTTIGSINFSEPVPFEFICAETCSMKLNASSITLEIEIQNITINISTVTYETVLLKKENKTEIKTTHDQIRVGRPVRWIINISTDIENLSVELPAEAENISISRIEKGTIKKANAAIKESAKKKSKELAVNMAAAELHENVSEYSIEYYTEAPVSEERQTKRGKIVRVSAPDHLNYTDVIASAAIDEMLSVSQEGGIKILWVENNSYLNFNASDSDGDNKIDYIEWIVPHLSNQTFEIILTILNVHSHPSLYGNWTVEFETFGTANLTITATNEPNYTSEYTRWSNFSDDSKFYDLKFLEIKCGNETKQYEWRGGSCSENECSLFMENYGCNSTGYETSKVLTAKKHILKFQFGDETAYAYNAVPAQGTPLLNTTENANTTAANLTVYNVSTIDTDGDLVKNIINWKRNGISITVLNMPFEGGSNATWAKDYSGHGNNGTVFGALNSSTGGYEGRGAYSFDGVDDYILVNDTGALGLKNQFTIEGWFKPANAFNDSSDYYQTILDKGSYQLYLDRFDGKLKLHIDSNETKTWYNLSSKTIESGSPRALMPYKGDLYVAGSITNIGGEFINHRIVRWNGTGWLNLSNGTANTVYALAVYNGELYAGGIFRGAGGIGGTNYIARWNGTGWLNLSNGTDNAVNTMAVYNGELYVGGAFTSAGGLPVTLIARWNGTDWRNVSEISLAVGGTIETMAVHNGELYLGGRFRTLKNPSGNDIADTQYIGKWNGAEFSSIGSAADYVFSLTSHDNALYAGGVFTTIGGVSATRIAKWNGTNWSALGSGFDNTPYVLQTYHGELHAGGDFQKSGSEHIRFAKWNGSSWINATPNFGSSGIGQGSMVVYQGSLFIGGGSVVGAGGIGGTTRIARLQGKNETEASSATNNWSNSSWHHFVISYNSVNLSLYVNGILEKNTSSSAILPSNSLGLLIGTSYGSRKGDTSSSGPENFNGSIDEIRIYNRSLSEEQVKALFMNRTDLIVSQETLGNEIWQVCITPNDGYADGETNCSNNLTIQNTPPTQGIPILNSTESANKTAANLTIYNVSTFDDDNDNIKNIINWKRNGISITVLNMPFEGGSNLTWAKDYSGFGNNATVYDAAWSSGSGFDRRGAYSFDGVDDYMSIPDSDSLDLQTQFTIEGRFLPNSTFNASSDYYQGLLDKGAYQLYLDKSDGKLKFYMESNQTKAWANVTNGTQNSVYGMAVYNGELYVGGPFTNAGGVGGTKYIARWNGTGWRNVTNGTNNEVYGMAVYNGELYVGGLFTNAGGVAVSRIARWNGTDWRNVTSGTTSTVYGMAVYNGEIYVGGQFTSAGGVGGTKYIARWNGTGWRNVTNGTQAAVYGMAVYNGELYVSGLFSDAGGVGGTSYIARWNGTNWRNVSNGTTGYAFGMAVYNGEIYVGGQFTSAGGVAASRIARWNGTGWRNVSNGTTSDVRGMAVYNGELYVGGAFTSAGGVGGTKFIARWNGTNWRNATSGTQNSVFGMTVYNGELYVGGEFTDAGGVGGTSMIARWSSRNDTEISSATNSWQNSWQHYALTYNNNNLSLYVNGIYENSALKTITLNKNSLPLLLGKTYGSKSSGFYSGADGNYQFNGTIDEIRIYNASLSAEQVKALYNNRTDLIVADETNDGDSWQACITPNDGTSDGAESCSNNITIANTAPTQNTPILNSASGKNGSNENLTVYNQSTADSDGDLVKNIINWKRNGTSATVLNIPFEGGSNAIWTKDYSGFGNNATVYGASLNASGGYDNRSAYYFDGVDDYILINDSNSLDLQTQFTIEGRFLSNSRFNASADYYQGILDKGSYQLYLDKSDGKLKFYMESNQTKAFANLTNGTQSQVTGMAVYNGELYVGGAFTSAGGVGGTNRIARWNGTGWRNVTSGTTNDVRGMAVYNGELYAGGAFTSIGGVSSSRIARWNGIGWNSVSTGTTSTVNGMAVYNGELYVGGQFTSAGGIGGTSKIARWNGTSWRNVTNGTQGNVQGMAVYNGELYVGGDFVNVGGVAGTSRIARWNGTDWRNLSNGTTDYVNGISVYNGELYIGGIFTSAGGVGGTNYIARWNGTDWRNVTIGPQPNNAINVMVAYNGELYAGGAFTSIGGVSSSRIARWNGTNWIGVPTGANSQIYGMTVYNGELYVGGGFTSAGGVGGTEYIAKWSSRNDTEISSATNNWQNNWQHYAISYNNNNISLYINGIYENSVLKTTTLNKNNFPLLIGKAYGSKNSGYYSGADGEYLFNGSLDEIRIYNISLSAEQIKALYSNRTDLIVADETNDGDSWQACITPNDGAADGNEACSNSLTIVNAPPNATNIFVNSTTSANYSTDNITVYFTYTDPNGDSMSHNETMWFNATGGVGREAPEFRNYTTLYAQNTTKNQTWFASVRVNDGANWSDWWNSTNITIVNSAPMQGVPLLNATFSTNYTNENLTVYNISTSDADNDHIKNIIKWKKNNASIAVLNMPFESSGNTFAKDYSGFGNNATVYGAAWSSSSGFDSRGAFAFDGINNYISIPDSDSLDLASQFAIEGRFKPSSTFNASSGYHQGLLDKGSYQFYLDKSDGKLKFYMESNQTKAFANVTNGTTSTVFGMAVYNGELYAGGSFTSAGGVAGTNSIARWNGAGWNNVTNGTDGPVYGMTVYNGELYAGGSFTSAGGVGGTKYIARWNGTHWRNVTNGTQSNVRGMAVYNGELYVGGEFTGTGGLGGTNYIARWNGTGWRNLSNGTVGNVNGMAVYNEELYVGGEFTDAGGLGGTNYIARWNGTGWRNATTGANEWIFGLAVYNGELYVGGNFGAIGGVGATRIAIWNGTGWRSAAGGMDGNVYGMAVYNGELYAGGEFTDAGGLGGTNYIARWNGTGWKNTTTGANEWIFGLAVYNGELYAGGNFGAIGGVGATRIARWNGTGWRSAAGGMDGNVYGMAVYNGELYAGGEFLSAGEAAASRIARWNGTDWRNLTNGTNSYVYEMAVYNGELYLGGAFSSAGGVGGTNYIAKWSSRNDAEISSATNSWQSSWQHYAVTYNNNNLSLFVNGVYENSALKTITLNKNGFPLLIGKTYGSKSSGIYSGADSEYFFNGSLDEIRIYNVSLSAEQVKALYNNRTDIITASDTAKNEIWQACITPNDGTTDGAESCSNNITIRNRLPNATNIFTNATSSFNYTTDDITVYFTYSDDDSDVMLYNETMWFNWSAADSKYTEAPEFRNYTTLFPANTSKNQTWIASVRVNDGQDWSNWWNSTNITLIFASNSRWSNITPPEGVFEPYSALSGTHFNTFSIRFVNLTITSEDTLDCKIKTANGSELAVNATGISITGENYSLNHTVAASDSIIKDSAAGYLPWILKNCSITNAGELAFNQSTTARIYTHNATYWGDDEVTRAVACEGTPGVYFNNTGKCEFTEDTLFALQMRNGNTVNASCFNNPGYACSDSYCSGIFFPTCDPINYFSGYSALTDDPNGYATFTATLGSYSTPIAYTYYVNTTGTFKLRLTQALTAKTFSITIYNFTNVSSANVYGAETGSGTTSATSESDGTWNVAHNRLGSSFTGTLDLTFNVSFNANISQNRTLRLVIAYGTDQNQGDPALFNVNFTPSYGVRGNNESENSSIMTELNGVCGDGVNNDFDYLGTGGAWANSYDCYDADCSGHKGANQTNEFGANKIGLCNYQVEADCSDQYDNDYDGLADCHDSDCFHNSASCPANELVCNDGLNNDWDYTNSTHTIQNNGSIYNLYGTYNITDCQDIDCNSTQGGTATQFCNWGYETNCTDNFNNDELQLKDCEINALSGNTSMPGIGDAEYDCSNVCRVTNYSAETGALCDNGKDDDYDAIVVTGYYTGTANTTDLSGTDCRWGGYFSIGTNYNPDENCANETMGSGKQCQLGRERTCSDSFDNDYDQYAGASMPHAGWSANISVYENYFGQTFANYSDYDDYDCAGTGLAPRNESANASWCFDGIDNDLDAYYFNGSSYTANSSAGIDCYEPECIGISNPSNVNQTCLLQEYNATDSFFTGLSQPGMYCANTRDDDVDGQTDCSDTDCFRKFDMCSQGPCYVSENITWDSCADSSDNDNGGGTDCADSACNSLLGSLTGAICQASTEITCDDGFDNDADGSADCADSNCAGLAGGRINNVSMYCRTPTTGESSAADCSDGFDNDADGNLDCYDSGCEAVCYLTSFTGTTPTALPTYSGQITLESVATTKAKITQSTRKVRKGELYNITLTGVAASTTAQWTLGTATGGKFNKTAFDAATAAISGPDAATFSLTETDNGWRIQSTEAHALGYRVVFSVNALETMDSTTYELTFAESSGSLTSLANNLNYQVIENILPEAHRIKAAPESGNLSIGSKVYIRANISDNNALGLCDWNVYGAASFDPANNTQCKGNFTPTIEGNYFINVTPVDYYLNIGNQTSINYTVNLVPAPLSIVINKTVPFYNQSANELVTINATFNVSSTDSLGSCIIIAINASGNETTLIGFNAIGNSCYNNSMNLSRLADGNYRIFARATESTEGDIVESNKTAIFACSLIEGICSFADYDLNGKADICIYNATGLVNITSPANASEIARGKDTVASEDDKGAIDNFIRLVANVYNNNTLIALHNTNCSFYINSALIGSNLTNLSGQCTYDYSKSNLNLGWNNATVNITLNQTGVAATNLSTSSISFKMVQFLATPGIANARLVGGVYKYLNGDNATLLFNITKDGVLYDPANISVNATTSSLQLISNQTYPGSIVRIGVGQYYANTTINSSIGTAIRWEVYVSDDNYASLLATAIHADVPVISVLPSETPASTTSAASTGGGGGGGEGVILPTTIEEFTVNVKKIVMNLSEKESKIVYFAVNNTGSREIEIAVRTDADYIALSPQAVRVKPGMYVTVSASITAPEMPGKYESAIKVSSGKKLEEIAVEINVISLTSFGIRVNVLPEYKTIRGGIVAADVEVTNPKNIAAASVKLSYSIRNSSEKIAEVFETRNVEGTTKIRKELLLPRNLAPGQYNFNAELTRNGAQVSASDYFFIEKEIIEELPGKVSTGVDWFILGSILALAVSASLILYLRRRHGKKTRKKKKKHRKQKRKNRRKKTIRRGNKARMKRKNARKKAIKKKRRANRKRKKKRKRIKKRF